jgi:hypothetical protein
LQIQRKKNETLSTANSNCLSFKQQKPLKHCMNNILVLFFQQLPEEELNIIRVG